MALPSEIGFCCVKVTAFFQIGYKVLVSISFVPSGCSHIQAQILPVQLAPRSCPWLQCMAAVHGARGSGPTPAEHSALAGPIFLSPLLAASAGPSSTVSGLLLQYREGGTSVLFPVVLHD